MFFELLNIFITKNDKSLFERVFQINKIDKNCQIYRQTLKIDKIIFEKTSLVDYFIRDDTLYKKKLL